MKRAVEISAQKEILRILSANAGSGIAMNARSIVQQIPGNPISPRQAAYILRTLRAEGRVAAISWGGGAALYSLTTAHKKNAVDQVIPDTQHSHGLETPTCETPVHGRYCITAFAGAGIQEWCEEVHTANLAAGWWDQPRSFLKLLVLVNTELAEAVEGDRKGIADDHLPQFAMREVEIADAIIRMGDIIGWHIKNTRQIAPRSVVTFPADHTDAPTPDGEWFLEEVNYLMNQFSGLATNAAAPLVPVRSIFRQGETLSALLTRMDALVELYAYVCSKAGAFGASIDAKRVYNLARKDHKPENRVKDGGKSY